MSVTPGHALRWQVPVPVLGGSASAQPVPPGTASASAGVELVAAEGRMLPAGWYRLGVGLQPPSALSRGLGVAVDHGPGEDGRDPEPLVAGPLAGTASRVLLLERDAHALRLAGDGQGAALAIQRLDLQRIGRAGASLAMLSQLARAGLGPLLAAMAAALLRGLRQGTAGLGAGLHEHYRRALRLQAGWPAPRRPGAQAEAVDCALRTQAWSPFTGHAQLVPAHQLRLLPGPGDGDGEWEATGEDPQWRLVGEGGRTALPAGWYEFRCRIRVREGQVVSPTIYPDYGDGFRAEELVLLPDPGEDGGIRSLVLLKYDTVALRLDPSLRRARFHIDGVALSRLGRAGASLRMLDGIRDSGGQRHWRATLAALGAFAGTALRRGTSEAGAGLFERYQQHRRLGAASYDAWVRLHDTLSASDLVAMRASVAGLPAHPRISLLVPVYQTPVQWLRRCIDSVLAQVYPHWELCLADDASPDPRVRELLRDYERRDPRIRVSYRERNGHISEASNSALAMATGDYIGLLDHDDELRPHALLEMAAAIAGDPALRLLYSDEDKIDEHGRRFQPYFKPDWNPDLLLGQNYLCHFSVVQTELARQCGGFRTGFEGSQDHDLLLRCVERITPAQIRHVPRVLYHWRAIEGSTALHRDAKDYAADAGARAVAEHLARTGADARVEQLPHGHYRVHWALPQPAPKVSLVVPTRDRVELLRTCIESVLAHTRYPDFELLVVDNGSVEPETLDYLAQLQARGVRVLRHDEPFNYARINNFAVGHCQGSLVGLLNNDVEVITPDWLEEMAGQALRPGIGAVGAMLYYPNESIQHAGVILGLGGVANHAYIHQPRGCPGHGARAKVAQNLSAVTAACLLVRRETYLAVGGLDETLQVAFNDIDFCLRLRERGLRNVWTPFAELYHHESASRGQEDTPEKRARFLGEVQRMEERWGEALANDPAYNPNLSLDSFNFDLAFPPRLPRTTRGG